jgi:hypothetical protein
MNKLTTDLAGYLSSQYLKGGLGDNDQTLKQPSAFVFKVETSALTMQASSFSETYLAKVHGVTSHNTAVLIYSVS